ncbi:LacI family DNA-binding transcriptional regulator [Microlunatus ginsengisoli]|uniref:LacI family DNA-binding transcriptional regulator n=1 Tax=Microlunatus ginsengisoli TaxID=363863 RepID=A0ABP7AIF8_9ACTN
MGRKPAGTAGQGAVTRADVARYAGVSDAVVSFVVNGGPKSVSEPTAARVREAIAQLGYRPNSTARALALGSTRTLGLVVPDATNPFYAEYTVAIQRAAAKLGFALLTISSGYDPAVELRGMLDLCDRQVDGLLLARGTGTTGAGELARRGVRTPVVLIDSTSPYPGHITIGSAAADGVDAVVEHLLRVHDHASVSLIIGDTADADTDGRETGWLRAHARNRRSPGQVEPAPFTRTGGHDAGIRLLQRTRRPTAIVTGSDLQAVGLLRAVRELGLRVPEDVALASFDGTEEASFTWSTLTTSRQPIDTMAEAAVSAVLVAQANEDGHEPGASEHRVFATDLVIGESCGC